MDTQLLSQVQKEQLSNFLSVKSPQIKRLKLQNITLGDEVTVITGVRRCGKSYAMRLIAQKSLNEAAIYYLDFEDPRLLHFKSEDFERSHEIWLSTQTSHPKRVIMFFDEPHIIDQWERWMTHFAKRPGYSVVLTGSNSQMLSSDLATFLTGRHKVVELSPFSFSELAQSLSLVEVSVEERRTHLVQLFENYITFGGFPKVWLDRDLELLPQYFQDIVGKDISARDGAAPSHINRELGITLMTCATRLTNKTKLARQIGFKMPRTISKHIHAFMNSYLLEEVRLFSPALKVQQRSLPKFYPVDHALAKSVRFSVLDDRSLSLECMVAAELRRRGYELFYWHSSEGYEVDFIARKMGAETLAIQVSLDISNTGVLTREIRALGSAVNQLHIEKLFLITAFDRREVKVEGKKILVAPFWEWALEGGSK